MRDRVGPLEDSAGNIITPSPAAEGVTLHESTHNGFLQIMHPRTFLIKNPSDAKLASLSVFRKWPVSMATIAKIGNY